jgi:two-component system chemotaxis sensor kinase CheA
VTKLVSQHELVARPLPEGVAEHAPLTGGAVLPDGQIALIVDCDALGEGASRVPATAPALA